LAKIAVELDRALTRRSMNGDRGHTSARRLAQGNGWTVSDVICTCGPEDHPFEEKHSGFSIAIVAVGTFQYRSTVGGELMTPGSLLFGNAGKCFECTHEHGRGDRCLSFGYTPDSFERLAADAGVRRAKPGFRMLRLPPLRAFSPLVARAIAGLGRFVDVPWEEISLKLAARAVALECGVSPGSRSPSASAVASDAPRDGAGENPRHRSRLWLRRCVKLQPRLPRRIWRQPASLSPADR
jgi:AraC family transcriptional regulator